MAMVKIYHKEAGEAVVSRLAYDRVWKGKGWRLTKGGTTSDSNFPASNANNNDDKDKE